MTQPYVAGFALTVLGRIFPNAQRGMFIDWTSAIGRSGRYVRAYDKSNFT